MVSFEDLDALETRSGKTQFRVECRPAAQWRSHAYADAWTNAAPSACQRRRENGGNQPI
jgi:hypothetical protein